jgi:hypothetical protein
MEQLIFIALIFFFSIIESISRRRKRAEMDAPQVPGEGGAADDERRRSEGRGAEGDGRDAGRRRRAAERSIPSDRSRARPGEAQGPPVPTYDAERSYDDAAIGEPARRPQTGSEGMIPADLWKEIERLARGEPVQTPEAAPPRRPRGQATRPKPLPPPRKGRMAAGTEQAGRVAPRAEPIVRHKESRSIHAAHAGFGTDPSERPPSPHDKIDPLGRRLNAEAAAIRKLLRSMDPSALRQAVILQEVLGPPVSLRPEPFSE